jgi:AbrB family looped-hinge helix DNA binding protein
MTNHQETTFVSERGTLTLPASIRKELGLKGKQQVLVETTEAGEIILRPAYAVPIEYYTEARIAEFASEEEELGRLMKRLPKRQARRKPRT